ncbi:LacI family DNA-binding transcriptional regulator [Aliamphritea hakodatensis]|uniref:LacI family DNA-binding transcriptional regulator n=1 Tax=Aliamphritea hakodatensis TaxID=2895352 RepID=UPI0022FD3800|nr:LacI family DNA-binding transcriptional regulator [Aliamphritea hakodatensis]
MNKAVSGQSGVRQVAKLAGVSVATVSRVFNQASTVRPDTRDKVMAAAKQLNYVPNSAARSLTMNRSYTIGIVIPTIDNSIFARFIDAIEQTLATRGYGLIVATCGFDRYSESHRVEELLKMGIEGLILSGAEHDEALLELIAARNLPLVCTSLFDAAYPWPTIGYDNYSMGKAITRHLLDHGHRQFHILSGPRDLIDRTRIRVQGILDGLHEAGVSDISISETELNFAAGCQAAKNILTPPLNFTALLCTSDVLAMGVLLEAPRLGIRVPQQLSVTGFDDQDWAAVSNPGLTSVHTPSRRMGDATARALMDNIEQNTAIASQLIDSHLVIRDSSGPAPSV